MLKRTNKISIRLNEEEMAALEKLKEAMEKSFGKGNVTDSQVLRSSLAFFWNESTKGNKGNE